MSHFRLLFPLLGLLGCSWVVAQEPQISNQQPLPTIQTVEIQEPVAVPETLGATCLAGLGFLFLFGRRRF